MSTDVPRHSISGAHGGDGALRRVILLVVVPVLTAGLLAPPTYADSGGDEETDLTVEVGAEGDYVRDYDWSIGKSVDATQHTVQADGSASFHYTVEVRAGQETLSGWRLDGTATVTNPRDWGDEVLVDLTASADVGGGASCEVVGGQDVAVAAMASVDLPITCTFTSAPATSGSVEVTATWDNQGGPASASASTGVQLVSRDDTDRTVVVVDDQTLPGQRVVLDPALTWEPGLVRRYSYDLALPGGPAGACVTYTNTAVVDLTGSPDPTASTGVVVCSAEVLPAQGYGKALGWVRATCQGTVRARLVNASEKRVTYRLRIGRKVRRIHVAPRGRKTIVTRGPGGARVVLKQGHRRLSGTRIPALCQAPVVLPDTGLRAAG